MTSETEWGQIIDWIDHLITREHNELLSAEISDSEVKQALFQMHLDKSPGPDGMMPAFYQKHWSIVGNDVVALVRKFFQTGQIHLGLNYYYIDSQEEKSGRNG